MANAPLHFSVPVTRDNANDVVLSGTVRGSMRGRFLVETEPVIEGKGEQPAHEEYADDEIAEIGKTFTEVGHRPPEAAFELQLAGNQTERLDSADQKRHHDGDGGDGEVVPELPNWIEKGPAIGADHQHTVGGVEERHAGGEQRRKNHHIA